MEQERRSRFSHLHLSTHDLAVAGVFGALSIVLAFTPLGLIPVPNPTEAATSLHLPAIIAGILAGPFVGALVGLVLAISSWYLFSPAFMTFAGGNLLVALLAAFLPRILIGVVAYYTYRPLRRWPPLAVGAAAITGTLTNTWDWAPGTVAVRNLTIGSIDAARGILAITTESVPTPKMIIKMPRAILSPMT